MLNRPTNAVNKRVVMLAGVVLAMMAMLVISSPAPNGIFAHPHVPAEDDHIHYAENGTGPVRNFASTDPEGSGIEWNVRGVDAADFAISSTGVLTFIDSPDFENSTDRGLNLNPAEADTGDTDEFEDAGEFAPNDNDYQITVSATEMSAAVPAKRTDIALKVTVENADDIGEVTLQWLQPEVGTRITATLTDPDGGITGTSVWTWSRSKVVDPEVLTEDHWNVIADSLVSPGNPANTVSSYTPQGVRVGVGGDEIDEDEYLRVKVVYTDGHGASKTKYGISMNPVRAEVSSLDNGSPDFDLLADTRTVPESTAVGDPVGSPVAATDPDNDTLTYELDDDADPTNTLAALSDLQFFDIDMGTGQIEVAQELDFDAIGARRASGAVAGTYTVTVRATDPSGEDDYIPVTITASNVNEDPIVTGQAELSVAEGITGAVYVGLPDAPDVEPINPESRNYERNEYVFEEPDYLDSIESWDLEGDDAGAFDLSGRFEPRYLQFKVAPDYENPTDANDDNVYEVTLVATDTKGGIGKVNVWLIVGNVEETGKVVFTEGETAYLNEMLVAEVQDPDDHGGDLGEPYEGVHIVNWQWSRALTDVTGTVFEDIVGATTDRYTPKDTDSGYYLRATADYTDPLRTENDPLSPGDQRTDSLRIVMVTTDNAVRVAPGPESAPTFSETGTVTREVAENTPPGGDVGAPVAATAANTGETLAYTLAGSDAQYFNIDDMGQITVGGGSEPGTDPELNYDDSEKKQSFSVTVKVAVTDGDANQNAEVEVSIIVTDVNELPEITDADGDAAKTAVDYPEIDDDADAPNTAAVATYVGTDPEGATISWDLRGADAALFTIAGGVLQFRAAPDYENPRDVIGTNTATSAADAGGNTYSMVIRAIASRFSGDTGPAETVDTTVTVTVTDVEELGEVVLSWLQPEVGFAITASSTDPDGADGASLPVIDTDIPVGDVTWVWTVSKVALASLDVGNDDHWGPAPGSTSTPGSYTPHASDATKYLRVTAIYPDRKGADKKAPMMSANPVQAAGGGSENGSPDFENEKVERSVDETAAVDDNVGTAVTAPTGGSSAKDRLTYGLRAFGANDIGGTGLTVPSNPSAAEDAAAFNIDKATGQITVARKLDFESRGSPENDGKYLVVVTVTDPSGLYDSVAVVITALDINESPVLSGRPELTIEEIDGGTANAPNPNFEGNVGTSTTVNVYNVDDEDDRAGVDSWALAGEDAAEFQLIGTVGRTLVFTTQPDYENPADANGDNIYKVTVVAIDRGDARGEFDVSIAVMNINEAGKVTLLDEDGNELVQPRAQGPITAELTDPDGGVTGLTWQWARSADDPLTGSVLTDITNATSATYTPSNGDTGYYLKVTATYNDAADSTGRTAEVTAAYAVLEVLDLKQAPAFPQDTIEVTVAENSPSTTYVGEAIVAAVDPDKGTTLIYTLEGDDDDLFELVPDTRQIMVSGPVLVVVDGVNTYPTVDLDKEDDKKNTYTVELKASDGNDDTDDATITVTITVTERNEAPSTPIAASGAPTPTNNAPMFPGAGIEVVVAENTAAGTDISDPVAATDADDDTLTYTLGGDDMASFDIDSATGQLMTKEPLDYETKASYAVEVMATDVDGASGTIEVTITVTDMGLADSYDADENGVIDSTEVLNAVEDYFSDPSGFGAERVLDIVELYFSSFSS